jgi:pyruvate kinase
MARMNFPKTQPHARTKIVVTVGPASSDPTILARLIQSGADVFRLNMAHGSRESHEQVITTIRQITTSGAPVAILIDLAGPKLRLGQLLEDPLECLRGESVRFIRGHTSASRQDLVCNYESLVDDLDLRDEVLLADGTVHLVVTEKHEDAVVCRVQEPGMLRSRQGIHLPAARLGLPPLTDHDRDCVAWAATQPIDFLSLSFVRSAADLKQLRSLMAKVKLDVPVIAKIEKREALAALEPIVAAADGVMVARGDLGVEIDVAEVPVAQKRIIQRCREMQKPVIVATEMLDSMQTSPRPTRAEATDVANASLDGADACMLSGETAVGEFPVESVATMNRILVATEPLLPDLMGRSQATSNTTGASPVTSAVVFGAGQIAERLDAKLVVITTRSGATALTKSNQRDFVPTVAVSADEKTLRRSALYWGIRPLSGAPVENIQELRDYIFSWGKREGVLADGDTVVFVAGSHTGKMPHDSVSVHVVE